MKKKRKTGAAVEPVDLLVAGGTVLTLDERDTIVTDGAVAVRGDRITAVGPRRELERRTRARRRLEARDRLILPGLVNAHTHAPMTLFRGVSDDQELLTWLQKYMFPLEAQFVSADFVRWGARLACWEMIASGTTTFADGYFFEEAVAEAADESGLRALPGQGIFDVPTPDARDSAAGLKRAEAFLTGWRGHPRVTPALAPHSTYTVEPETFRRVQEMAARFGAPVLLHVAESQTEMALVRERYATTPVRHLAALGVLDKRMTAAHCVWVDAEDIRLLAAHGVGVAHCAESNMKLASGIAPLAEMLAAGVAVGLGTDGPASNNDLDMFGEMATVAKVHKAHSLDPTRASAGEVLRLATRGAAAALHLENEIGSLEPGKRADLIVVNASSPNALPLYHPYSYLTYSSRADAVETVIVDGRILMERRALRTLDTEAIRRRTQQFQKKIVAALND